MKHPADQVIHLYRVHAQAWSRNRGTDLFELGWLNAFKDALPASAKVLDLGCGHGQPLAKWLMDQGFELTGVDVSPELIDMAQTRFPDADWIVADMREWTSDQTFDGLLAWDSLFHLRPEAQRRMFERISRLMNDGGALMLTSAPGGGEQIGTFQGDSLYHAGLDVAEVHSLLHQHGFEVISQVTEDPNCEMHTVWLARFRGNS